MNWRCKRVRWWPGNWTIERRTKDAMYALSHAPTGWTMDFWTLEEAKESALFLTGEMWDGRMS